jgi:ABC-type uncharacterized transport system substrate-binding protein
MDAEPEPRPTIPDVVEAQPPQPAEPVPHTIAVVLSDRTPAYEEVASELGVLVDDYLLYDLADKSLAPAEVFAGISESQAAAVIVIGLPATREAIRYSTVPIVFCQVFNIGLAHDTSVPVRGIASTPPLDMQVSQWKQLNPGLRTIGTILGEGHEDLVAEAGEAAARHGIGMDARVVGSDRETLFEFQRMAPAIDGFWLFPDNRVLSVEILQSLLDYASRHDVQTVVFNPALLKMGATLSAATVASDIAATALSVAQALARDESVPRMTPLTELETVTRDGQNAKIELASGPGLRGVKP